MNQESYIYKYSYTLYLGIYLIYISLFINKDIHVLYIYRYRYSYLFHTCGVTNFGNVSKVCQSQFLKVKITIGTLQGLMPHQYTIVPRYFTQSVDDQLNDIGKVAVSKSKN